MARAFLGEDVCGGLGTQPKFSRGAAALSQQRARLLRRFPAAAAAAAAAVYASPPLCLVLSTHHSLIGYLDFR